MRTTIGELKAMLENYDDDLVIVMKVRGNSTEDYSIDNRIEIIDNSYNDYIVIKDVLS